MSYYAVIFLAGIAGSFHCVGMCGGFACAIGANCTGRRSEQIIRQFFYNGGRVMVYAFLGGLAGSVAVALGAVTTPGFIAMAQKILTLAAGAMMIVIALNLLGLYRLRLGAPPGGTFLVRALGALTSAPGRSAPLAFGVFNGFLPCPLVYAFLAQAMSTGSAAKGMLTMLALGVGTIPAMALLAWAGSRFRLDWRRWGVNVAGTVILVLGLITVARIFANPGGLTVPS